MTSKHSKRTIALPKCATVLKVRYQNYQIMRTEHCTVVFDRKHRCQVTGRGAVEIQIRLTRTARKYITFKQMTYAEWIVFRNSNDLDALLLSFEQQVLAMIALGEEMTIANFNKRLCIQKQPNLIDTKEADFVLWMRCQIDKEQVRIGTRRHRVEVADAVQRSGIITTFADLTPSKIMDFDEWLHNGKRMQTTIHGYHKRLHRYVRKAYERGFIESDPYSMVKIPHGKFRERDPLTEQELKMLIEHNVSGKLERARDLFIFSAFTGMAYCDVMDFDFETMAEKYGDMFYISGKRQKTGSVYFSPILPPAMAVLEKYRYVLPKMSNQKLNDYLGVLRLRLDIKKEMTFHVARHSFATMVLSHDVPIEKLARMLGHSDIKTTQIYSKIRKDTIINHSDRLREELADVMNDFGT